MKPIIIVNYKTYKEVTGSKALNLSKKLEKVDNIFVAVQYADINVLATKTKLKILSQHVDYNDPGAHTGSVLPEAVKQAGVVGTLLNHAEKRISFDVLKKTVKRCKLLKLKTIVCVPSINQAVKVAKLKPDYIAFEYPTLIATGRSISTIMPNEVKKFASLINKTKSIPLCGAGISNSKDVKIALKLGTKGVLVASAIVKSKNPGKLLASFIK